MRVRLQSEQVVTVKTDATATVGEIIATACARIRVNTPENFGAWRRVGRVRGVCCEVMRAKKRWCVERLVALSGRKAMLEWRQMWCVCVCVCV